MCSVSAILAPSTNITTYLLTYLRTASTSHNNNQTLTKRRWNDSVRGLGEAGKDSGIAGPDVQQT